MVGLDLAINGGRHSKLWLVLSALASVVTIVTPIATIAAVLLADRADIPATILAVYVCLLTSGLLALLIRQEGRYRREARYAPAMVPARKAFGSLADASWTIVEGDGSEESFLLHLREALRFLAEAYSLITDSPCRVSVKMISVSDDELPPYDIGVATLCRNVEAEAARLPERDRIGNNTDFRQIFVEDAAYFFCNDLPAQLNKGYQNSHWDERTIQEGRFAYVATIVWPIGRSRALEIHGTRRREVTGFLCVDTVAKGAFKETYDVPIGSAFSQALSLALERYRRAHGVDT